MAGVQPELQSGFSKPERRQFRILEGFILSFYPDIFILRNEAVTRISLSHGELAQLARASALQAECQGFKSPILHKASGSDF